MTYAHVVPAKNLKNAVTIISGYVLPIVTEMQNVSLAKLFALSFTRLTGSQREDLSLCTRAL